MRTQPLDEETLVTIGALHHFSRSKSWRTNMSENWLHQLLPARLVLHSQLNPRVDIPSWVRHHCHLRLCCLQSHQIPNNCLGPWESHAPFLQKHWGGCAKLRQEAQPAVPNLAFPPWQSKTLHEFGHQFRYSFHHGNVSQLCESTSSTHSQGAWHDPLAKGGHVSLL